MTSEKLRILAIDDNQDNLTTLKAVVADALPGVEVVTALSGARGIELARALDPDVVLLDVVMPQMDGFEVCRRLKDDERVRHIPVVFVTALKTDQASRVKALETGAEGFLAKPLDAVELTAQIRAMAKIKAAGQLQRMEKERLAELVAERTYEFVKELANRRLVEEALRASENRTRALLEAVPDLIFRLDGDGVFLDYKADVTDLYDQSSPSLVGKRNRDVVPPEFADLIDDHIRATLQSGQMQTFEYQLPIPGRGPRDYEARMVATDRNEVTAIVRDITERKLAEEALRQSEAKFRVAFQLSPMAMSITDNSDGKFLLVNHAYSKMFGCSLDELIGKTSREVSLWVNLDDRERLIQLNETQGGVNGFMGDFYRHDGERFVASISSTAIEFSGRPCWLYTLEDRTEAIRAENDRKALEAQLNQAQKMEAIGTLAGGIAHDFNNILAAILGFAEMALDDAEAGRVEPADLKQIIVSAQRAKELVQRILAFSRKKEPDLKPCDLNQIVLKTQSILERTLPKMIDLQNRLAQPMPPIMADPTQIEQVLLNFASNAADAMPEGGQLVLETRTVVLDHEYCKRHLEVRPGHYVLLMVADTGTGIDQETQEHIFEPFFTTKEIGSGTGLGLSSVFGIVKSHGGHIHCHSEVGKGTAFKIYLPVYRSEVSQPLAEAKAASEGEPWGTETILLVDDEEGLRGVGSRSLETKGYSVLTATGGEEALEIFRTKGGQLDLVIMDLGMPGMGGHKAMKAILQIDPQAKVLIASGYSANAQVQAALESGAAGYVAKPFRRTELLTKVREVLDRR
jgi:PAS domain S-box-containing protein